MYKPNFFIIGAPKCGTTALSEYLKEHPNIYMSSPKEPHYFSKDLPGIRPIESFQKYIELFSPAKENHKAIGEASVWYLYSFVALKAIKKFNPKAKIIVMVRNPVDMVHSFHSQALRSLDEDVRDFEKAWQMQWIRKKGKYIPKQCREIGVLQYGKIAKFGEQIERLYSIFPRNQVKVIVFDDFCENTSDVFSEILDFLGVQQFKKNSFPIINLNAGIKSNLLVKFTQRPPKILVEYSKSIKRLLGLRRLGILRFIREKNFYETKRVPLRKEFREELLLYYKSDILILESVLERDLSKWYKNK